MQITLVSSSGSVSHVLNQFQEKFSLNWTEIEKKSSRQVVFIPETLVERSIRELKAMTDFLLTTFNIANFDTPKRNSKVSLAGWIADVLLIAREMVDTSETAIDQNANADGDSTLEVEVLEPEEKPVYTIALIADGSFSEEQVCSLPPYLIDRKGKLLKKFWHRSCDAGYAEIVSEQLSNIAAEGGLVIRLMTESLEVFQGCIRGNPPPFVIYERGVYKRDFLKPRLSVCYYQIISECLSNIVVV
jgi:hypothetical protein